MKLNLTNDFVEVPVSKGSYQAKHKSDLLEVAVNDFIPTKGEGFEVSGNEIRNFDTNGSKLWVRSVYGDTILKVVLGFL
ncbi:MAG: hypothetical protein ACRCZ2_01205 [Fusobacteriaceae bacterium]